MARRRRGQRAKSEMNVVPYIDVMLVLLVIFMISAPLLNQSVEVELPHSSNAADITALDSGNENEEVQRLVISIDQNGALYIDRSNDNNLPVNRQMVAGIIAKTLRDAPKTQFHIRADKRVDYGSVMVIMDFLKDNGVPAVGFITSDEK